MKKPIVHRIYHEAFRLKIIELVETGEYSISELNRIYELGSCTILRWLRDEAYHRTLLYSYRQINSEAI